MNRLAAAAALLLALAPPPRAQEVLTVETKWNEKAVQLSTTGVTAATFDVGGFGAAGYAVVGNTQVQNGADGTTLGATVKITTATTNVVGFDYFLYGTSSGTLKIAQTLTTPSKALAGTSSTTGVEPAGSATSFSSPAPTQWGLGAPAISTSSALNFPSSVPIAQTFRAQVQNPVFYLTNLSAAATYYLTVNYGVPHHQ